MSITKFHVKNYKALRDVSIELTPLHLLIGPNDSGKTSILEAITALHRSVDKPLHALFPGAWDGRQLVWARDAETPVSLTVNIEEARFRYEYSLSIVFPESGNGVFRVHESAKPIERNGATTDWRKSGDRGNSGVARSWNTPDAPDYVIAKPIHDALGKLQSYHWIPSHLAMPVVFDVSTRFRTEPSGFGLPMALNDILLNDDGRYAQLKQRFRHFFPNVTKIMLERANAFRSWRDHKPDTAGLALFFELNDTHRIPAAQASDGMLLALAYLAILFSPDPPRLLLIEEPENGIHPQRLREILDILRQLVQEQDRTQVILTTHSPYVVDRFKPEEITLCLKGSDGAVTTRRLSESKTVRDQIDIFQVGEIWTAEGDEALAQPIASQ